MEYILISAFPHSPQIYFFNLFHFTIIILYIVQRYETKCSSGTSYPLAGWSRSIEIRDHKIPRRDDNVALKALRATTDRVATLSGGSPAYAGPDCFYCRFWCRRLGQKRVGLGSLRWQPSNLPTFLAGPSLPPPLQQANNNCVRVCECSLTHIGGRAAAHDCP